MDLVPSAIPTSSTSRKSLWLVAAAILISAIPWVIATASQLLDGPFLWAMAFAWISFGFYIYLGKKTGWAAAENRRAVSISAVLIGLAITAIGGFLLTFKIAWFGILLSVSGLTLVKLGAVPWTRVVAMLSLIWIAWPWPAAIYERIDTRLHRLGVHTATAVFDLLSIPVFSQGNVLEFRSHSLDSSVWMDGPDSFVGLLLFAAWTLVRKRRTLVPALFTVLSVPLVVWVGEATKILLCYWAFNSYALDLSTGWPLICLRLGIFAVQLLLILMVNRGVYLALLPVLVDPNARNNVRIHSLFNVVTLWPLQISISAQRADQDYLGDFDDGDEQPKLKKRLITRRAPDVSLAAQATNPWINPKLYRTTVVFGGLAMLLSLAANLLPAAKPVNVPQYEVESVKGLADGKLLDGLEISAQFTNAEVQLLENQFVVSLNLAGDSGPVVFRARFPSRINRGIWTAPQGMTLNGPTLVKVVEEVTMYEASFVGQMGANSMGWFAAMLTTGESLPERGWRDNLKARLSNSLLGGVVGFSNQQWMYETALIVDSQSVFTERQKREYRTLLARLSLQFARSLRGIQQ